MKDRLADRSIRVELFAEDLGQYGAPNWGCYVIVKFLDGELLESEGFDFVQVDDDGETVSEHPSEQTVPHEVRQAVERFVKANRSQAFHQYEMILSDMITDRVVNSWENQQWY